MWDTLSEKFTAPASYDRRVWVAALLSFLIGFLLLPLAAFFLPEKYRARIVHLNGNRQNQIHHRQRDQCNAGQHNIH